MRIYTNLNSTSICCLFVKSKYTRLSASLIENARRNETASSPRTFCAPPWPNEFFEVAQFKSSCVDHYLLTYFNLLWLDARGGKAVFISISNCSCSRLAVYSKVIADKNLVWFLLENGIPHKKKQLKYAYGVVLGHFRLDLFRLTKDISKSLKSATLCSLWDGRSGADSELFRWRFYGICSLSK